MTENNSTDFRSVKDFYEFTMDDLEEKCGISPSPYWANCITFYERVQNKSINALSAKEAQWLEKINEDLGY